MMKRHRRAVKQALYDHEWANLLHVESASRHGVVYLDGEVDQYVDKEETERIARGVEGVKGVVNKLQVQP
jgi:osmotically-inducible protein OsmY